MESLSETTWDVIICGTGLQQSLLALALSRSDKKILHIDPNGYYGGAEAAFSLQEADAWASEMAQNPSASSIFTSAVVTKPPPPPPSPEAQQEEGAALSFPRAYALALSPQLIHARSKLLSQLVSSRAFRQLEFLAVGSFFIYKKPSEQGGEQGETCATATATATLTRIPSTREDVFSSADLSARAKRHLMKFLKLVLAYQDDASRSQWHDYADRPLAAFLADKMGFADDELRTYITTLTLSLDGGEVTTGHGLETVHRHLTSMGMFGPGFAALYPKWGGGSEIAQVACRAGAVGGGIYMLGTGIKELRSDDQESGGADELVELVLTDDTVVKTRLLVRASEEVSDGDSDGDVIKVSRMVAILGSPLTQLFEPTVEGSPVPAVAVVAFPPGSVQTDNGVQSTHPIFASVHSSDTGECPPGQSTVYLHTIHTPDSKALLESALASLRSVLAAPSPPSPSCLYQLYYEQKSKSRSSNSSSKDNDNDDTAAAAAAAAAPVAVSSQQPQQQSSSSSSSSSKFFNFPTPSVSLTFDDTILDPVQQAWAQIMGGHLAEDDDVQFMAFADREGVGDDDDFE